MKHEGHRKNKSHSCHVPFDAPFWWTAGLYPGASKSIIEVETDEGLTGLGEAPWWHFGEIVKAEIASAVAFGAVELALWDLRGKALGMPLYKLLGGAVRTEIPFTEYFSFRPGHEGAGGEMSAEAVADYCQRIAEEHTARPCSRASSSSAIRNSRSTPCDCSASVWGRRR